MIFIVIFSILFILGVIKKNSKLAVLGLLLLMWLVISNNYYNADYQMYSAYYQKYGVSSSVYNTEILFQLMCKVSNVLNLTYESFLKIYFFITLSLIYLTIRKMSKKGFLVLLCYLIFPFFLDVVQIRHFMSVALICYGFACLINDRHGEKKYLIFNLLALGFHFNSIFFLPLVFVKKINLKKVIIPYLSILALSTIIIRSDIFIKLISFILPSNKVYAYFISNEWNAGFKGFIIFSGLQILTVFIVAIVYYVTKNDTDEKNKLRYILIANLLLLLVLPLYTFTIEFTRVFRGFMLINYIGIINSYDKYLSKNNLLRTILIVLIIVLLFYFLIIYLGIFNKTIVNIFEFNKLFE